MLVFVPYLQMNGVNMKNLFCFFLIISLCFVLFSCSGEKYISEKETSLNVTESKSDNEENTEEDNTNENYRETESEKTVSLNSSSKTEYGKRSSDAGTFTGLNALKKNAFPDADFTGKTDLSHETVSHAFGVAKDEKPNLISVQNQDFFDNNNFRAFCFDNNTEEKILYLTFDCGYENGYTGKILDTLKVKKVKAAFFCTKPEMESNPEIIARMINEGHIVGNHSVHHPDFSNISREKMYDEVKGFDDYIRENFGYSSSFFRYPQGKYSEDSLYFLNSMGYDCIFWSLAYEDWDLDNQKGSEYAENTVVERLHPGAIILLHSVSPDNAAALGNIIDEARSRGYEFRSLDEL